MTMVSSQSNWEAVSEGTNGYANQRWETTLTTRYDYGVFKAPTK